MALEKRKSKSLETLDESKKILVKTVKMTTNKDQFLIRLPREVKQFLEVEKGDKFQFLINIAPPNRPKSESKLSFKIIHGEKNYEKTETA